MCEAMDFLRECVGSEYNAVTAVADAPAVLSSLAGKTAAESPFGQYVLSLFSVLQKSSGLSELIRAADELRENAGDAALS